MLEEDYERKKFPFSPLALMENANFTATTSIMFNPANGMFTFVLRSHFAWTVDDFYCQSVRDPCVHEDPYGVLDDNHEDSDWMEIAEVKRRCNVAFWHWWRVCC